MPQRRKLVQLEYDSYAENLDNPDETGVRSLSYNWDGSKWVKTNAGLGQSSNWIGLVSTASITGNVTLNPSNAFIGLATTVAAGFSYAFISLASITTVKSGAGILHSVIIGSISTPSCIIYSNTTISNPILGVIPVNIPAGTTLTYDANFTTGLTFYFASGVPPQVTVTYR